MSGGDDVESDQLIRRAKMGDVAAVGILLEHYRARLKRIIQIRIDPRLQGRIDPSDVLQDTYIDVHNRIGELTDGDLPFFLWLRLKLAHRLTDLHRFHFRKKRHSAGEVSIAGAAMPNASSASVASLLVGALTSPSDAAARAEAAERIEAVLNSMDEVDREVIVLRHFEDLSNSETATVLNLSQNAASNRYVRALRKLKASLDPSGNEHG